MACKSAWIPAPPPESDPAIVYTMGGLDAPLVFGEEREQEEDNIVTQTMQKNMQRQGISKTRTFLPPDL